MAESTTPIIAEARKIYVSTTAPATLTDPTLYKIVGLQQSSPVTRDKPSQDVRWKGGALTIFGSMRRSQVITLLTAGTADDGQVIIRNAQISGAQIWFLLTDNVTGHPGLHYTGYVGGGAETDGVDGAIAETFTIGITGTPTPFTVA